MASVRKAFAPDYDLLLEGVLTATVPHARAQWSQTANPIANVARGSSGVEVAARPATDSGRPAAADRDHGTGKPDLGRGADR